MPGLSGRVVSDTGGMATKQKDPSRKVINKPIVPLPTAFSGILRNLWLPTWQIGPSETQATDRQIGD